MKIDPPIPSTEGEILIQELETEFELKNLLRKNQSFYLTSSAKELRNTLALLKNKFDFIFLVDFFFEEKKARFIYILKNLDHGLNIIIEVEKHSVMPSMKKVFCGVVWAEKAYAELLGIEFKGNVYRKMDEAERFYKLDLFPEFDYSRNQKKPAEEISYQRLGPLYTNFFGHLALDIEVKDELVTRAKFFLHPEGKNLFYNSYVGNLSNFKIYLKETKSMVFFESLVLFYKSLEERHDYSPSQEMQIHRMIFLELERVKFLLHQLFLYFNAQKLDSHKIEVSTLIQKINDQIIQPAITSVLEKTQRVVLDAHFMEKVLSLTKSSLSLAQKFKSIIQFTSNLTEEEPYKFLEAGISGHMLRSFGIDFDLRVRQKYLLYGKIETKSNLSTSAWVEDLYQLKIEDIEESCRLIKHLIRGLSPVAHQIMIESDVLDGEFITDKCGYYSDLEGSAGLSSICFNLGQDNEIVDLHFRSEIIYQLQKYEFIDYPEAKEQFFKKLYASPLFLLEA